MPGGPVRLHLPWLVDVDPQRVVERHDKEPPEKIIDALVWLCVVELLPTDERDAALYVVLRELGERLGAPRRREALQHLLQHVGGISRLDVPRVVLHRAANADGARIVEGKSPALEKVIEDWSKDFHTRPRFCTVRASVAVDALVPFDVPKMRGGVTAEVDRELGRLMAAYYSGAHDISKVVETLDGLFFEGGLTAVMADGVTDRHRVMALRWALLDKRFPLFAGALRRLAPAVDGELGTPRGTLDTLRYGKVESALAPLVAAIAALHASPALWQRTQTWTLVLSLVDDLRSGEKVQPIVEALDSNEKPQCEPLMGLAVERLREFEFDPTDASVRRDAAATLLSAVARAVETEPAPAVITKALQRLR